MRFLHPWGMGMLAPPASSPGHLPWLMVIGASSHGAARGIGLGTWKAKVQVQGDSSNVVGVTRPKAEATPGGGAKRKKIGGEIERELLLLLLCGIGLDSNCLVSLLFWLLLLLS